MPQKTQVESGARIIPAIETATTTKSVSSLIVTPVPDVERDGKSVGSIDGETGEDEADAVLRMLRKNNSRKPPAPLDLRMGCFTESPETSEGEESAEKTTGEGVSGAGKGSLQSLLMQVVGQVANYNERINQETDNRKAIVKMLETKSRAMDTLPS